MDNEINYEMEKQAIFNSLIAWADKYNIPDAKETQSEDAQVEISSRGVPRSKELLFELEILDLGGFDLPEIPDEIGFLTKLRVINVSLNRLTALPETLCNLKCLIELKIDWNHF